jgi:hypothetical protein
MGRGISGGKTVVEAIESLCFQFPEVNLVHPAEVHSDDLLELVEDDKHLRVK